MCYCQKTVELIILTHLAYIGNGKKSCSILQEFTGRNVWRYMAPFCDIILPTDHVSLTSFLRRIINIRNTCKRLRYSQTFGGISLVKWRKVGRIWRIHRGSYMSADELLNLLNELGKRKDARLCRASYRFSPTSLINSILQEHECKILFIIWH